MMQVAGAMLGRMGLGRRQCTCNCRPQNCPVADAVRDAFEEVTAWTEHLSENAHAQGAPRCRVHV